MADLAGPISLAEQIRLVAGLRWRMLVNGIGAVVTGVVLLTLAVTKFSSVVQVRL